MVLLRARKLANRREPEWFDRANPTLDLRFLVMLAKFSFKVSQGGDCQKAMICCWCMGGGMLLGFVRKRVEPMFHLTCSSVCECAYFISLAEKLMISHVVMYLACS